MSQQGTCWIAEDPLSGGVPGGHEGLDHELPLEAQVGLVLVDEGLHIQHLDREVHVFFQCLLDVAGLIALWPPSGLEPHQVPVIQGQAHGPEQRGAGGRGQAHGGCLRIQQFQNCFSLPRSCIDVHTDAPLLTADLKDPDLDLQRLACQMELNQAVQEGGDELPPGLRAAIRRSHPEGYLACVCFEAPENCCRDLDVPAALGWSHGGVLLLLEPHETVSVAYCLQQLLPQQQLLRLLEIAAIGDC